MDIFALLFLLLVTALVGLFIASPFIKARRIRVATQDHEISSLMAERDRVVNALQELDFDQALGKIPAEDYPVQRAALLKHGAEVLRKLDELLPSAQSGGDAAGRIEAVVAKRRADASEAQPVGSAPTLADDDIEAMIAARRSATKEKSGGFCPSCGRPVLKSDKFCPHCGKTL